MFVDQFRQSVDLYSSPNSRWVIKTEYKEIEKKKALAHIYIDFVQMYTYNDFSIVQVTNNVLHVSTLELLEWFFVYVTNCNSWKLAASSRCRRIPGRDPTF